MVLSFEKQQYCFWAHSQFFPIVTPSDEISVKIKQIRCIKWENNMKEEAWNRHHFVTGTETDIDIHNN